MPNNNRQTSDRDTITRDGIKAALKEDTRARSYEPNPELVSIIYDWLHYDEPVPDDLDAFEIEAAMSAHFGEDVVARVRREGAAARPMPKDARRRIDDAEDKALDMREARLPNPLGGRWIAVVRGGPMMLAIPLGPDSFKDYKTIVDDAIRAFNLHKPDQTLTDYQELSVRREATVQKVFLVEPMEGDSF